MSEQVEVKPEKKKLGIIYLAGAFLGPFGIHRMLLGYPKWWMHIVATCLCIFPGVIWSIIDMWKMVLVN